MSISAGDISPQPLSSQQDLQTMIRIPGTSSGVNIAQNKIQVRFNFATWSIFSAQELPSQLLYCVFIILQLL